MKDPHVIAQIQVMYMYKKFTLIEIKYIVDRKQEDFIH